MRKRLVELSIMDRIIRFQIGILILVCTYLFQPPILWFAGLHVVVSYIWVTVLIAWDPFYYVINFIRRKLEEHSVFRGDL